MGEMHFAQIPQRRVPKQAWPSGRRIKEERISNPDNLWYGTKGGSETNDKVFLLSLEEVDRYFGDSGDYLNKRRKDPRGKNGKGGYYLSNGHDGKRKATHNGSAHWWWLRSPGIIGRTAAYVSYVGGVSVTGNFVSSAGGGVRPALWLNL